MERAVLHAHVYQYTRHVPAHQLNAARDKSNDLAESLRAIELRWQ